MFDRFGTIMVVVSDMSRSVAWYRDVLGLTLKYETPYWSEFDVGGVSLGVHPSAPHLPVNPECGVRFGFYTEDIEKTLAELTARGAHVIRSEEQEYGILSEIADPDGYRIQVCQLKTP